MTILAEKWWITEMAEQCKQIDVAARFDKMEMH